MLNGLLNIGQSALNASQAWISVTGNNIANADTEGYSRQYVDQKDAGGITYRPGAQPLGVNAQQILRFFDQFLEKSYVSQSTNSSRWDTQDTVLSTVENLFNESNRKGVSSAINSFLGAWQDLALRPDDTSVRQSLLSYADNLSDMFKNTASTLKEIQQQMDVNIEQGVARINEIAKAIAELNGQITRGTIEGMSNPNALLDKRDQLVRELATYVDVESIDHGKGEFRVQLKTGQPLVDGTESYSLDIGGIRTENMLISGSSYNGSVKFQGTDDFEYTLEIVETGDGTANNPAKFRVSLDNGRTWLEDANGNSTFDIVQGEGVASKPVRVKELDISFTNYTGFTRGDKFDIIPKSGLYWIEPTKGPENVTPQIYSNGQDNPNRITGGKLAAYYSVRDDNIGRYLDQLDATSAALVWEVNRIHSQGAGLVKMTASVGQYHVADVKAALGSAQAMLPYGDRLQQGNVNFHFYDSTITDGKSYQGSATLAFNGGANFNPQVHTLEDVALAINSLQIRDAAGNIVNGKDNNPLKVLKADIQDGKLLIQRIEPSDYTFALGADTSGLMAALGINTFFAGSAADEIAVNSAVHIDTNLIAAGSVNGQFEVNAGDNSTATAISRLTDTPVKITTFWKNENNQTIGQYYANLVATIGADKRNSKTNSEYHATLTNDLFERVSSVSGVNMDEEMSKLIKYQHSYTAAAKLITTADEMLQTLLGIKQ